MSDLLQFTDGLQTTTSTFLRKEGQLEKSINVHGDNVGILTKRLGYSKFGDTVSSGNSITGLYSYADIGGGTTRLFAFANGTLKYYNGTVWTSITSLTPTTAKVEMRVFLDQLFVFGSDGGTYVTPTNIDGTTVSTATNLTSAPKGKFVEVFLDQLYVANVEVSSVRYPSRVYRSSLPDTGGTLITWPSTNYESILTNNGEELTGMHTNKMLNQLLLFKDTSCHAWDGFRIRDIGNVGTNAHRSIQTINFTTFFYSQVRRAVYAYSGVQPQSISRGVKKWIRGIQDPTAVHAGQDEDAYKLYLGTCVVDGETYTNCEFRYSVADNTVTIYSYHDTFKIYAEHKVDGFTRLYGGASDGDVHQMAIEGDAVYSDDSNPIAAEFMTKALYLDKPSNKKFVDRAALYTINAQNLQGRMRERGKDWSTYFSIDKPEDFVNLSPNDSNFIQFHFSENSTTSPFQFEGLSFTGGETTRYA